MTSRFTELNIDARVVPLLMASLKENEQQQLLIARGTEEQIAEIRQVVEAMDIRASDEEEGQPQNKPQRPGGRPPRGRVPQKRGSGK